MCGIAGVLTLDRHAQPMSAEGMTERMVSALAHRGPDGRGIVVCGTAQQGRDEYPRVVLGHTRLAILDLSDRAAQPMKSSQRNLWITFNGEIYNFRDLKRQLEATGRTFRSDSDAEVILHGYDRWGDDVLSRLRGIFSFAIWDGDAGRLLLARDHLGVKPLYVYQREGVFCFASEVRALLASEFVPRRLDQTGITQYLAYQTVPPPRTLIRDVRMVLPGHSLVVTSAGDVTDRRYWDLLDDADDVSAESSAGARRRVGELLTESIALNLVSDVPVGVFLSGGIDSSAIVSLIRKVGHTPRTLSIAMPGSAHDESHFARRIAQHFGADHTEIPLTPDDFVAQLPSALARIDHPSGDGLNTFVVSQVARASGLKVALSGLGGDEMFGGYPSFHRMRRLADYGPMLRRSPRVMREWAAAAVRGLGRRSIGSRKAAAVLESDGTIPQAFPVLRELFDEAQREALLGGGWPADPIDPYRSLLEDAVRRHPHVGGMTLVSFAEARTYMHDVLLRDTDQMSMAHGLEVRVPLLDHRLVAFVMGLDDEVKTAGESPKQLLLDSLGDALPADCVLRPKQGFVLPFDQWMKTTLRPICEHHLGPNGIAARGVLQLAGVRALWQNFLAGSRQVSWSRPWALVALAAWTEKHGLQLD